MPEISVMVDGGKATAGAPLGPALGPTGINIGKVVASINEKTKAFAGMKVPVKVIIDTKSKDFEISVGSPPTSALIKKEANVEKGTANPKETLVGDISFAQAKKIAEMKMDSMASTTLRSSVREVIGTCQSMGIKVDGMHAKEAQKKFEAGEYDSQLK
ncbi:MAG: 50S ribosomal protein L11 [Candidatus Diapherotrites archaeon]|nr:50S ribosomal protein L11 [Candidatus Diapherotrites archaeon]